MIKKRVLISVGLLLLLILGTVAGIFAYMQISLFEVEAIEKEAMKNYISDGGVSRFERKQDNLYYEWIPSKAVNDEVTYLFVQQSLTSDTEIVSGRVDIFAQTAELNYRKGNIYIPIKGKIVTQKTENGMNIRMIPESYGKAGLTLPDFINRNLFKSIFQTEHSVQLNIDEYSQSINFVYEDLHIENEGLGVDYLLKLPDLQMIADKLNKALNPEYIKVYEEGDANKKEAIEWVLNYPQYKEEITGKVFDDYISGGSVLAEILALAEPDVRSEIYTLYPQLETVINQSTVIKKRSALVGEMVNSYAQVVLESLRELSKSGMLVVSKGYPFDFNTMQTVTVEGLIDQYQLNVADSIRKNMNLIFVNEEVYITYQSKDDGYYVISLNGYEEVDQQTFLNKYNPDQLPKGHLTDDESTYEELYYALFMYYDEDVFIRYIKNDANEAYAIISLESNYQEYKIVLLRRDEGKFQVLADDFATVAEANAAFPDFNMNLGTRRNEEGKLLLLNSRTKRNIEAGLRERGFMEVGEKMIYCSYDGVKYIAIKLNSGEQYIYTIYRNAFLEDVYTKEEALKKFSDINPLILLQDIPGEETI